VSYWIEEVELSGAKNWYGPAMTSSPTALPAAAAQTGTIVIDRVGVAQQQAAPVVEIVNGQARVAVVAAPVVPALVGPAAVAPVLPADGASALTVDPAVAPGAAVGAPAVAVDPAAAPGVVERGDAAAGSAPELSTVDAANADARVSASVAAAESAPQAQAERIVNPWYAVPAALIGLLVLFGIGALSVVALRKK
jgi:hypothetical protein